ncbi:MAG: valine--tRNA ligase [Clostridiaceae bacterium]|nr:valine--tRNA ligase [Clostridiaceae bacterium]
MSERHELPKIYDPHSTEDALYKFWEDNGFFHAEIDKDKTPFTIVIPPPNVTGQLHMGHAFDNTLQDILIRTKRMQGYSALWMPGTDHAGIATQIKVEESLRENGETRFDYGRDGFVDLCWQWKERYGSRILNQLRRLGSSCDWDRLRFTMDEGCNRAVREVFVNLYNKGLIYKGYRIVNWCPHCNTALSDTEVDYEEQAGHLWHIRYPIEGSDEFIIIATTRPETMMGDTGIAIHPDDERYTHLIGKKAILPLMNRPIPIFADDYVEKEFGTGCVKVTPCHDPNDFEMAARHDLEYITVIDSEGKITKDGGKYCGMTREEARKAVVADLEAQGYLVKVEEYKHNVGTCCRCHTSVEPMASTQWFVKMGPLAGPAIDVVKNGDISFVPDRFSKIYMNWMENIHDWCISRQLWWGHRIPAYYCEDCGHMMVCKEEPHVCEKCGGTHFKQDEDVLDTWFSSALWPFSTLGWPDKTPELDYFYPTDVLVTGYDIIFFWVARMIFSGMEHMNERPFKTVFLHGIIRDDQGRKMSKSLGNGVDPIEIIDKYGADALRFMLVTGIGPGNDARFYTERVEANRNFANKIWNASRFVLMNLTVEDTKLPEKLELEDKWILTLYNRLIKEVTENIDKYELGVAADKLYSFIWDNFCDWFIELSKIRLNNKEDMEANENAQRVLIHVLSGTMQLLHPFMPFITESVWQALPHEGPSIMVSKWPEYSEGQVFDEDSRQMEQIMEVIRAIRNRRSEMNVPPSKKAELIISSDRTEMYENASHFFKKLAYASDVKVLAEVPEDAASMVSVVTSTAKVYMPMSDLVDTEKELERLNKEKDSILGQIARIEGKLNNPGFLTKAPEAVVASEKQKLETLNEHLSKLEESINNLK